MALPDDPGPTDDVLVREASAGSVRALDTLLERYQGPVLRVVRLLGVPVADREDVAQEVFLRVFRHLHRYQHGRSFSAWVYRVAVNGVHDFRLRSGRRRRDESPWSEDADLVADTARDPEEAALREELRRRLEQALDRLSERERAVFVLHEMEGLETREVAHALGVTAITVRRHLGLARGRLRKVLEGGEEKKPPIVEREGKLAGS